MPGFCQPKLDLGEFTEGKMEKLSSKETLLQTIHCTKIRNDILTDKRTCIGANLVQAMVKANERKAAQREAEKANAANPTHVDGQHNAVYEGEHYASYPDSDEEDTTSMGSRLVLRKNSADQAGSGGILDTIIYNKEGEHLMAPQGDGDEPPNKASSKQPVPEVEEDPDAPAYSKEFIQDCLQLSEECVKEGTHKAINTDPELQKYYKILNGQDPSGKKDNDKKKEDDDEDALYPPDPNGKTLKLSWEEDDTMKRKLKVVTTNETLWFDPPQNGWCDICPLTVGGSEEDEEEEEEITVPIGKDSKKDPTKTIIGKDAKKTTTIGKKKEGFKCDYIQLSSSGLQTFQFLHKGEVIVRTYSSKMKELPGKDVKPKFLTKFAFIEEDPEKKQLYEAEKQKFLTSGDNSINEMSLQKKNPKITPAEIKAILAEEEDLKELRWIAYDILKDRDQRSLSKCNEIQDRLNDLILYFYSEELDTPEFKERLRKDQLRPLERSISTDSIGETEKLNDKREQTIMKRFMEACFICGRFGNAQFASLGRSASGALADHCKKVSPSRFMNCQVEVYEMHGKRVQLVQLDYMRSELGDAGRAAKRGCSDWQHFIGLELWERWKSINESIGRQKRSVYAAKAELKASGFENPMTKTLLQSMAADAKFHLSVDNAKILREDFTTSMRIQDLSNAKQEKLLKGLRFLRSQGMMAYAILLKKLEEILNIKPLNSKEALDKQRRETTKLLYDMVLTALDHGRETRFGMLYYINGEEVLKALKNCVEKDLEIPDSIKDSMKLIVQANKNYLVDKDNLAMRMRELGEGGNTVFFDMLHALDVELQHFDERIDHVKPDQPQLAVDEFKFDMPEDPMKAKEYIISEEFQAIVKKKFTEVYNGMSEFARDVYCTPNDKVQDKVRANVLRVFDPKVFFGGMEPLKVEAFLHMAQITAFLLYVLWYPYVQVSPEYSTSFYFWTWGLLYNILALDLVTIFSYTKDCDVMIDTYYAIKGNKVDSEEPFRIQADSDDIKITQYGCDTHPMDGARLISGLLALAIAIVFLVKFRWMRRQAYNTSFKPKKGMTFDEKEEKIEQSRQLTKWVFIFFALYNIIARMASEYTMVGDKVITTWRRGTPSGPYNFQQSDCIAVQPSGSMSGFSFTNPEKQLVYPLMKCCTPTDCVKDWQEDGMGWWMVDQREEEYENGKPRLDPDGEPIKRSGGMRQIFIMAIGIVCLCVCIYLPIMFFNVIRLSAPGDIRGTRTCLDEETGLQIPVDESEYLALVNRDSVQLMNPWRQLYAGLTSKGRYFKPMRMAFVIFLYLLCQGLEWGKYSTDDDGNKALRLDGETLSPGQPIDPQKFQFPKEGLAACQIPVYLTGFWVVAMYIWPVFGIAFPFVDPFNCIPNALADLMIMTFAVISLLFNLRIEAAMRDRWTEDEYDTEAQALGGSLFLWMTILNIIFLLILKRSKESEWKKAKNLEGRFDFTNSHTTVKGPVHKILPSWDLKKEIKNRIWQSFWDNVIYEKCGIQVSNRLYDQKSIAIQEGFDALQAHWCDKPGDSLEDAAIIYKIRKQLIQEYEGVDCWWPIKDAVRGKPANAMTKEEQDALKAAGAKAANESSKKVSLSEKLEQYKAELEEKIQAKADAAEGKSPSTMEKAPEESPAKSASKAITDGPNKDNHWCHMKVHPYPFHLEITYDEYAVEDPKKKKKGEKVHKKTEIWDNEEIMEFLYLQLDPNMVEKRRNRQLLRCLAHSGEPVILTTPISIIQDVEVDLKLVFAKDEERIIVEARQFLATYQAEEADFAAGIKKRPKRKKAEKEFRESEKLRFEKVVADFDAQAEEKSKNETKEDNSYLIKDCEVLYDQVVFHINRPEDEDELGDLVGISGFKVECEFVNGRVNMFLPYTISGKTAQQQRSEDPELCAAADKERQELNARIEELKKKQIAGEEKPKEIEENTKKKKKGGGEPVQKKAPPTWDGLWKKVEFNISLVRPNIKSLSDAEKKKETDEQRQKREKEEKEILDAGAKGEEPICFMYSVKKSMEFLDLQWQCENSSKLSSIFKCADSFVEEVTLQGQKHQITRLADDPRYRTSDWIKWGKTVANYRKRVAAEYGDENTLLADGFWYRVYRKCLNRTDLTSYLQDSETNNVLQEFLLNGKDGLDYLYTRLALVDCNDAVALWYLFWTDFYQSNREMGMFTKKRLNEKDKKRFFAIDKDKDFNPANPESIALRPMKRSDLEKWLEERGMMATANSGTDMFICCICPLYYFCCMKRNPQVFTNKALDALYLELEKRDFPVEKPTLSGSALQKKNEAIKAKKEEIIKIEIDRQKRADARAAQEKSNQLKAKQVQKAGFLTNIEYNYHPSNPHKKPEEVTLAIEHTMKRMVELKSTPYVSDIQQRYHTIDIYQRKVDTGDQYDWKPFPMEVHKAYTWEEVEKEFIPGLKNMHAIANTVHEDVEFRLPTIQELKKWDVAKKHAELIERYGKSVVHTVKDAKGQVIEGAATKTDDVFVPIARKDGTRGDYACIRSSSEKYGKLPIAQRPQPLALYECIGDKNRPVPEAREYCPNGVAFRNLLFVMRRNVHEHLEIVKHEGGSNRIVPKEKIKLKCKEGTVLLFKDPFNDQELGSFMVPHNSKFDYHTINKHSVGDDGEIHSFDLVVPLDDGVPLVWFDESKEELIKYETGRNYWRERAEEIWKDVGGFKMKSQVRSDAYKLRHFPDKTDLCTDPSIMRCKFEKGFRFVNETEFEFQVYVLDLKAWDAKDLKDYNWESCLIGDWDPSAKGDDRGDDKPLAIEEKKGRKIKPVESKDGGNELFISADKSYRLSPSKPHAQTVYIFRRMSESLGKEDWCACYISNKYTDGTVVTIDKQALRTFVTGDVPASHALSDDLGE